MERKTKRMLLLVVAVSAPCVLLLHLYSTSSTEDTTPEPLGPYAGFKTVKTLPSAENLSINLRPPPRLLTQGEQMKAGAILRREMEKGPDEYKCAKKVNIPNYKTDSWTYCADSFYIPKKPCLVYSFGVNWDYGFEDGMEKLGCEVFSYDPSMDTTSHRRSKLITFHPVGLGHVDADTFVPRLNNQVTGYTQWHVRTLKTLVKDNKHEDRVIDVLKIDIETYEWNVTRNMLDSGILANQVKQLILEWHVFPATPAREQYQELVDIMEGLRAAGLKVFHRQPHGMVGSWDRYNLQSDMGYINAKFLNKQ